MRSLSILFLLITPLLAAGKVTKHSFADSQIFPGTQRDYWVYVPEQYDATQPACLMVFQDGHAYVNPKGQDRVPERFDELISAGEMPVTIGLFINPGVVPAAIEGGKPRKNRCFEYDSMTDRYARFLIEEMIPLLESEHGLKVSSNPDDRAIAGASSGAICAFTAAWQRPDAFRRVFSAIGTYVDIRSGGDYPTLIRKTEPKPLRIFLEDGSNDLDNAYGNWFLANQTMLSALQWSGYEVNHQWGEEGHNHKHSGAILPDALRWLWKDHGQTPVTTHVANSQSPAKDWLIEGEEWERITTGHQFAEGMQVTPDGTLYFTDVPDSELYQITPDGTQTLLSDDTGRANGLALSPDGKTLYLASSGAQEIRSYEISSRKWDVVASGTGSNDLVVTKHGHLYYTDPGNNKVWHVNLTTGKRQPADPHFQRPNGIGLSPDHSRLYVAHFTGNMIYNYTINPDGSVKDKQPYFHAHLPYDMTEGRLDGMASAASGELLCGTEFGIQIFDDEGRSKFIIPRPHPGDRRTNYLTFGGPNRQTLYLATADHIYKRQVKLQGAP
ncbi:SMP-30/gluconolactonase/LRE family protein [Roseibacillus persicicus]|uniref:SMP-30/gluconolactonase/LRE family protein n=1 Tax=Roseibacillus persicicus TaxID=454148 RepID=UPI00280CFDC7|nr:SMP-30/gluconolactonase/LRE family protein [Roseibacillus persicicus]MDQ8190886.1 SMP-30/gluconolactonase/LRE family protein [Roseibacillus persicicus]